jgi:predicted RNase H-like HicB family nuclease
MTYAVLFEKTDTGYSAHVPDLPGCVAAGATLVETTALIRGAIRMHLDGMVEDGEPIPQPSTLAKEIEIPPAA